MNTAASETAFRVEDVPEAERIRVTERAARHIRKEMAKVEGVIGFRVAVQRSGCSGWMYTVDFVREPREDDLVFHIEEGLDVYVDRTSFGMIKGTEIDFISEGLTRQLKFHNPNAASECGCGESFSVA